MPKWSLTEFVKNIVQPTVTLSGWFVYLLMVWNGTPSIPANFEKAVWLITATWFAQGLYQLYRITAGGKPERPAGAP